MAKIVAGYATSHIAFSLGSERKSRKILDGMAEIGRRVTRDAPDIIVMIVGDHLFNFNLERQSQFILGTAQSYDTWGDMGIPSYTIRGHAEFSETFLNHAAVKGFDLATAEYFRPDHGVALPMLFIKPKGGIPLVPLYVNIAMDPTPSPRRCFELAKVLKETIEEQRPEDEKVVVMGSGGLSHWLGIPGMGRVNTKFDNHVIDLITSGRCEEIANWTPDYILQNAGNGGWELLNWMMMAATLPDQSGEKIYYVPMHAWMTGMGGVALGGKTA